MSVAGKAALGDLRPVQNAQHVVRHRFVVGKGFLDLSAHFFAVERLVGQVDGGIGQRRPLQLVHHTGLAEKLGDHGLDLADNFFVRTFVGSRQLGQHLTDVLSGGIDGFVAQNGAVQIQAVAGHARGGAENVLAGQAQRQHSAAFALQKAHGQNVEQIFDRVHRRHIVAGDQLKAVLSSGHGAQGQHGAQQQSQKDCQQFVLFHRWFSPFNDRFERFLETIFIIQHSEAFVMCFGLKTGKWSVKPSFSALNAPAAGEKQGKFWIIRRLYAILARIREGWYALYQNGRHRKRLHLY